MFLEFPLVLIKRSYSNLFIAWKLITQLSSELLHIKQFSENANLTLIFLMIKHTLIKEYQITNVLTITIGFSNLLMQRLLLAKYIMLSI